MTIPIAVRNLTVKYVDAGCSVQELSGLFNVPKGVMRGRLKNWGLKARQLTTVERGKIIRAGKEIPDQESRNCEMCQMYLDGHTLQQVGERFGITRERVRQILVKNGVAERFTSTKAIKAQRDENWNAMMALYLKGEKRKLALRLLKLNESDLPIRKITRTQYRVHKAARFWNQVDRNGPVSEKLGTKCWEWKALVNPVSGYGRFTWERDDGRVKTQYAHRVAYEISKGRPKQWVLHWCDNVKCVNPDHLYDGTPKENCRDREVSLGGRRSRLSFEKAQEIRRQYASGVGIPQLAEAFGCCGSSVYAVVRHKTWTRQDSSYLSEEAIRRVWALKGIETQVGASKIVGVGVTSVAGYQGGDKGSKRAFCSSPLMPDKGRHQVR